MSGNLNSAPQVDYFILALITLIAIAFRLAGYEAEPYWTDEIYSLVESGYPLSELLSAHWLKAGQMPLFFILLKFWRSLAGSDRLLLLLPNIIAGSLCAPLTWSIARRLPTAKRIGPLAAAGLVALSPLQIHHSQELRMYPLVVMLALLAMLFYLKSFRSARASIGLFFFSLALGLTHGVGSLLIAAMGLCLFLVRPKSAGRLMAQFAALTAAGLPLLIIIGIAGDFSATKAMTTGNELTAVHGLLMYLLFLGPGYAAGIGFDPLRFLHPETIFGSAFILLLFFFGIVKSLRNTERTIPLLTIVLLSCYFGAATRFNFINQPKYLLYGYPLVYCVATVALDAIPKRAPALALTLLAVPLWIAVILLRLQTPDYPAYRDAAAFVGSHSTVGEKVYLFHNNEFNPFAYYYANDNLLPPELLKRMANNRAVPFAVGLRQYLADINGVWYVRSTEYDRADTGTGSNPQFFELFYRAGETETAVVKVLSDIFPLKSTTSKFRIEIDHYSRGATDAGY